MIDLSGLLKNSAIFGIGMAVSKAVGLLLLPLYTHYLSPQDYGVLALLEFVSINFSIVAGGGFARALLRFYHDKPDQEWRNVAFCSCLVVVGAVGVVCLGIGVLAAPIISDLVLHSQEYTLFVSLILATTFVTVANEVCFTLLRVQERARRYVAITMTVLALSVALNVYFIAFLELGIMGFVLSGVISAVATLAIHYVLVIAPHLARPDMAVVREMAGFALPYVPDGFLSAFVHNLGLICLSITGDIVGAGLYAVGRKLGSVVAMLAQPLGMVWTPYMYKVCREPEAPRIFAVGATYLVVFLFSVVLFLFAVIEDVIGIIADDKFFDAHRVVLPVALGALAFTLGPTIRMGITVAKKTGYIPLITAAGTALGFPATYALTSEFGVLGAAWGAGGTWMMIALFSALFARRFLVVPYEFSRLIRIAVAALACVMAMQMLGPGMVWARLALVGAFPVLMWAFRVPTAEELAAFARARSRLVAMVKPKVVQS